MPGLAQGLGRMGEVAVGNGLLGPGMEVLTRPFVMAILRPGCMR